MKPLKGWKDAILEESKCWTDLRKLVSDEEAEKICAWDGWHPHHRWHLEMFFGLKQCIELKTERKEP